MVTKQKNAQTNGIRSQTRNGNCCADIMFEVGNLSRILIATCIPVSCVCAPLYCGHSNQTMCESASSVSAQTAVMEPGKKIKMF